MYIPHSTYKFGRVSPILPGMTADSTASKICNGLDIGRSDINTLSMGVQTHQLKLETCEPNVGTYSSGLTKISTTMWIKCNFIANCSQIVFLVVVVLDA